MKISAYQRWNVINDYAQTCLRDVADRDYILARVAYRCGLIHQFLYLGHEAIEKYLKAILLFHGQTARTDRAGKAYNHDLCRLYDAVKALPDIQADFPGWLDGFISGIHGAGESRYLDYPYMSEGKDLIRLDWTVWHLRRYCQNFEFRFAVDTQERACLLKQKKLSGVHASAWKARPNKFKIAGGLLEKVLSRRNTLDEQDLTRSFLVWKNPCYGARDRQRIRNYPGKHQMINTPLFLYKGTLEVLEQVIHIPKAVKTAVKASKPPYDLPDLPTGVQSTIPGAGVSGQVPDGSPHALTPAPL